MELLMCGLMALKLSAFPTVDTFNEYDRYKKLMTDQQAFEQITIIGTINQGVDELLIADAQNDTDIALEIVSDTTDKVRRMRDLEASVRFAKECHISGDITKYSLKYAGS